MPDEDTSGRIDAQTDETETVLRVADVTTASVSRRNVLRTTASALAGGPLLTTVGAGSAAAQEQDGLNVRTTDVEVLSSGGSESDKVRATGEISGMSNYDCERCEVGAHIKPVDSDTWHGGLQTVEHTHTDSIRVGVTLAGLVPGRYECRLCACPITQDHVFVANVLIVVIKDVGKHEKKKHHEKRKEKHHDEGKHHDEKDKHHGERKKHHDEKREHYGKKKHHEKYEKAYEKTCPCPLDHPRRYHLLICGGNAHDVCDYAFQVSSRDIHRVGVSNAPDVVPSQDVTIDHEESVHGTIVTGAVAGGADSYVCGGSLTDIRTDRGVSVYLNGMNVTGRGY